MSTTSTSVPPTALNTERCHDLKRVHIHEAHGKVVCCHLSPLDYGTSVVVLTIIRLLTISSYRVLIGFRETARTEKSWKHAMSLFAERTPIYTISLPDARSSVSYIRGMLGVRQTNELIVLPGYLPPSPPFFITLKSSIPTTPPLLLPNFIYIIIYSKRKWEIRRKTTEKVHTFRLKQERKKNKRSTCFIEIGPIRM